mmetsp:Transcript_59815/g.147008  ORF Transcript_59815/g.147008 Transcript_59815/m.147008 type:complete len:209 (-) Transcript_59815:145-771(-)
MGMSCSACRLLTSSCTSSWFSSFSTSSSVSSSSTSSSSSFIAKSVSPFSSSSMPAVDCPAASPPLPEPSPLLLDAASFFSSSTSILSGAGAATGAARLAAIIVEYFSVWSTRKSRCLFRTSFFSMSTLTCCLCCDSVSICAQNLRISLAILLAFLRTFVSLSLSALSAFCCFWLWYLTTARATFLASAIFHLRSCLKSVESHDISSSR